MFFSDLRLTLGCGLWLASLALKGAGVFLHHTSDVDPPAQPVPSWFPRRVKEETAGKLLLEEAQTKPLVALRVSCQPTARVLRGTHNPPQPLPPVHTVPCSSVWGGGKTLSPTGNWDDHKNKNPTRPLS